ncbi:MAG: toxin-antitoxin system YwqK family antitoxin, partial [Bacteroidota bacterium]
MNVHTIPLRFCLSRGILFTVALLTAFGVQAQDSLVTFRYPNGIISSEGFFKNGKPDGYWKSYYENGGLKSEGNRRGGLLDSLWKFYDEQGKKSSDIHYREGQKNGWQRD